MKLKYLILYLFLIIIQTKIIGQDLSILDEKNGFREIKLGDKISNYNQFQPYNSENAEYFGGIYYDYIFFSNEYDSIGETDIYRIFVNTYEGLIMQIHIITAKNFEVIDLLNAAYGPTSHSRTDRYVWFTDKVRCDVIGLKNNWHIMYEDRILISKKIEKEKSLKQSKALDQF